MLHDLEGAPRTPAPGPQSGCSPMSSSSVAFLSLVFCSTTGSMPIISNRFSCRFRMLVTGMIVSPVDQALEGVQILERQAERIVLELDLRRLRGRCVPPHGPEPHGVHELRGQQPDKELAVKLRPAGTFITAAHAMFLKSRHIASISLRCRYLQSISSQSIFWVEASSHTPCATTCEKDCFCTDFIMIFFIGTSFCQYLSLQ